jgi:hypothetical protein
MVGIAGAPLLFLAACNVCVENFTVLAGSKCKRKQVGRTGVIEPGAAFLCLEH